MAAPGNKSITCDFCFAENPANSAFCIECGAPLEGAAESDDADREVYADITRANLMRMRGDLKSASDTLLGILRRFPNNATAQCLLGDIAAEKNEHAQAIEWYEMAVDVRPNDNAIKEKLERARKAMVEAEAAASAAQLQIPTQNTRTSTGWFAIAAAVLVLGTGAASFWLGNQRGKAESTTASRAPITFNDPTEANPIGAANPDTPVTGQPEPTNAPSPDTPVSSDDSGATTTSPPNPGTGATPAPGGDNGDNTLLSDIRTLGSESARIISILSDPREPRLTVTLYVNPDEDPGTAAVRTAALIAKSEKVPEAMTLRVLLNGQLVLVGDISKSKVAGLEASGSALDGTHLENVWRPS